MKRQTRSDIAIIRRCIKRAHAYALMWKWGSDFGLVDMREADKAMEALDRVVEELKQSIPIQQERLI